MGLNLFFKRFFFFFLISWVCADEAGKNPGPEDQIVFRKPSGSNGCSFYCTLQLMKTDILDVTVYENLTCTHIIYGFATINPDHRLESPTSYDKVEVTGQPGNYEKIQWLKKDHPDRKTLLGIDTKRLDFISSNYTRTTVAKETVESARWHGFDGVFLHVDDDRMFNFEMETFLEILKVQVQKTKKFWNESKEIEIVYGFPAYRIGLGRLRFAKLQQYVDTFYLYADQVPSVTDPNIAIALDPLFPSEQVPREDSISYNAKLLVDSGIDREKLIIGLSTWARSYRLPTGRRTTVHNNVAAGPGKPGNRTRRRNGRLAYDEICTLSKEDEWGYDTETATVSFVQRKTWYSFNPPGHPSVEKKLKWISDHGFAGVGLSSLYGDDKDGICHQGTFPVHQYFGNEFRCKLKREKRGNKACTRMCGFDVHDSFLLNFTGFQPNWCSHVILSSASLEATGAIGISAALKASLQAFNKWKTSEKPYLVVSIGGDDVTDRWRFIIGQPVFRSILVQNIVQFTNENGIDGIDVSWTLGKLDNAVDTKIFDSFIQELRHKLPKKILIVSVTPQTTFNHRYNVDVLNSTADFIMIQGHRFHSPSNLFTGHHSPLFVNSNLLQDAKMTIEGFALDWVSRGVDREKLIVGFTAEGMAMVFSNFRTEHGSTIGALANIVKPRTYSDGKISQSDICALKNKNQTIVRFIEDLGVPYLVHEADFIAYDDEKSMKIKSIWASLSKFGGIALFNVEKDNAEGTCPPGNPYPLLKTISNTQVCDSCPAFVEYQKNKTRSRCTPEFQTVCHYRLPASTDPDKLDPAFIPFPHCTEIIIEEDFIGENGKIVQPIGSRNDFKQALIKAAKDVDYKRLVTSTRCNMTDDGFNSIMASQDDRNRLITSIREYIDSHGFMGIELGCDHLLTPSNKANFDSFLKELRENFASTDPEKCSKTISVRIPAWTINLNDGYETSTLNNLHHVTLDTFQISNNQSQLVSPLFGIVGQDQPAIDSTIRSWISSGLSPSSIVMTLPAYGILQKLSDRMTLNHGIGSETQKDFLRIISQNQICVKLMEPGINRKMNYQFVATYATSVKEEWLSFETQETITYKLKYALRQGLGGVGLMSLNEDDFSDVCKQGKFPLLETITRGKCGVTIFE